MQRLALGLLVSFVLAPAVSADWLILHDGSRLETRGVWKAKSSTVVFTTRTGRLSSLPISDIDLPASRQASAEPVARPVAAAPTRVAKPQPMAVITNDDIAPARRPVPSRSTAPTSASAELAMQHAVGADLFHEVAAPEMAEKVSWRRVDEGDFQGIEVQGTLENDGEGLVTNLGVTVSLHGEYDQVIASQDAVVQANSLLPGSYTRFLARFPGLEIDDDQQTRVEVYCRAKRIREKKKEGP